MKLPQGTRLRQQSLGRTDVSGPSREWAAKAQVRNAKANAFSQVAKTLGDIWPKQDDAEDKLLLRQRIQEDKVALVETKHYMANTPVIDLEGDDVPDNIRAFLADKPGEYADEGVSQVQTHKVMMDYTKFHMAELNKASMEALKGTAYQADYVAALTPAVVNSIEGLSVSQIKQRQSALKAQAESLYKDAIDQHDEDSAQVQIQDNVRMGLWSEEEGVQRQMDLGAQIDYGMAIRKLTSNSSQELGTLADSMYGQPNRMSDAQRMSIYDKAEGKRSQLDTKARENHKRALNERSGNMRNQLTQELYESRRPISYDRIASAGLDIEDQRALMALNDRMRETGTSTSNPEVLSSIQIRMAGLSSPSQDSIARHKRNLKNTITQGMINGTIAPKDAPALFNQIESMSRIPYNTTEYRGARDMIFTRLVGASEGDMFGFGNADKASKLNAYNMVNDMHEAYQDEGDIFEPQEWVQENMKQYMTKEMRTAEESLQKSKWGGFVVKGADKLIDVGASRAKAKQAYKAGDLSDRDVINLEKYIEQQERFVGMIRGGR